MDKFLTIFSRVPLFAGLPQEEILALLQTLSYRIKNVRRRQVILQAGQSAPYVGIVLSGRVEATRESYAGTPVLITIKTAGEVFCDLLACAPDIPSPVTLTALQDCTLLLLNGAGIPSACAQNPRFCENLLHTFAQKYTDLNQKLNYLATKSLRERTLSFLKDCAPGEDMPFILPFNRQDMAQYLNADRSALSRELSRMQKDGLITLNKRQAVLHRREEG